LQVADIARIEAHGPEVELDKLRLPLKDFTVTYWQYLDGAFVVPSKYAASNIVQPDDTVSMMVYWKMRDSQKFLKGCSDFAELTKKEDGVKYYGFTRAGDEVVCKEGYDSADGFLAHLQNVNGPLQAALQVADIMKIEAHGPQSELEKLREPLKDFSVTYWQYSKGAFFAPAKYA